MVPMLPCGDIDEMAEFWTALGLAVTYRQVRPNPYLALGRNGIDLHYYGMDGTIRSRATPAAPSSFPDTAPLYGLFTQGLRARYGRVPMKGLPRITRPRHRANNAGLSGFSLIDPAGNWIRVTRRPDDQHEPRAVNDRTEWVSAGGGPLARAVENAVVLADSHGDEVQAPRTLAGAVARHPRGPAGRAGGGLGVPGRATDAPRRSGRRPAGGRRGEGPRPRPGTLARGPGGVAQALREVAEL